MSRSRAYTRMQRHRAICRKIGILKGLDGGGMRFVEGWTRGAYGRLAKGKIHCSCWMCRHKSYDAWKHSDTKKVQKGFEPSDG